MISISNLLSLLPGSGGGNGSGRQFIADPSPSGIDSPSALETKPTVIWNATRTCNLNCSHCYSDSRLLPYPGELTAAEARVMIADLAQFGVPALEFSGGEPLMRPDLPELIAHARDLGIRPVLSTNGTLITPSVAADLSRAGVSYVGISLGCLGPMNDWYRGKQGAFETALDGLRNCVAAGVRAGLRIKITQSNFHDLEDIFAFVAREKIERVCFHHLVYAGRGNDGPEDDLSHQQTRQAMEFILRRAADYRRRGRKIEILTADNSVDAVFFYLKLYEKDAVRAAAAYQLLKRTNAAHRSGLGLGSIDHQGNVHADPYWTSRTFGNVRGRPFSEMWTDISNPLMAELKDPLPQLKGRCATCRWSELCGGGSRARAEKTYGDPWMPDPACYLRSEEMGRDLPDDADKMAEALLWKEMAA